VREKINAGNTLTPALSQRERVFLAAGGTGGHLFPAVAAAQSLQQAGMHPVLVVDARAYAFGRFPQGLEVRSVQAGRMGGSPLRKVKGALQLMIGIVQAMLLCLKHRPKLVVGFGGYPSFPTLFAALILRIPTMIHEQNALLGRANRWLARHTRYVALSIIDTQGVPAGTETRVVGNPVRPEIAAVGTLPYPPLDAHTPFHLLVLGGSQGATVFGEVIPEAVALLPDGLRTRLRLTQQCRAEDVDRVRARYATLGVEAELSAFFQDMPARYAACHAVIARAGASTIAELQAVVRPALLVPYPNAMDDHQRLNAESITSQGGGWMVLQPEFTPEFLTGWLTMQLSTPASLAAMQAAMPRPSQPSAAEKLVGWIAENTMHALR
jgi:UDP-N-acetylglucosamine--N-acetylmuramyl-(pentapeptide) pyrophosphoryl-undecaprenol N-acetylglucosamine transferase